MGMEAIAHRSVSYEPSELGLLSSPLVVLKGKSLTSSHSSTRVLETQTPRTHPDLLDQILWGRGPAGCV